MTDFDSIPLKSAQLAALLDLSVRRVQQLSREGVFERLTDGRFEAGPSIRAYLKVRAAPAEAEWRRRHERAMALLAEHKLKKLDAQYSDPMGLWPTWLAVSDAHIRRMLQLLNQLPPVVAPLSNPYDIQTVMEEFFDNELNRYADELEGSTPEPHRTRFRELRAKEVAEFAAIKAASGAKKRMKGNGHHVEIN